MKPTWQTDDGRVRLYLGDCLEVLRGLPSDSVDSVVTDPPYGLSFMGKRWDYDVPAVEVWAECLRVLKPGGCLLSFAGTRTQHRMAVRIEDAGFEIRDMIAWVYGSGFPKSHNGPWGGTALKPALEPITVARKPLTGTVAENVLRWGVGGLNIDGCRIATTDNLGGGGEKAETSGKFTNDGWRRPWMDNPASLELQAAKVRANVERAEALGRWPANFIHDGSDEVVGLFPESNGSGPARVLNRGCRDDGWGMSDKPGALQDAGSGSAARFFYCAKASKADRDDGCEGLEEREVNRYGEQGQGPSAQQTPRVTQRNLNHHPTVKPTNLMRYLCRLVTPAGGVVLDPFTGSGSTGRGAVLEGFRFIGMEREAEYVEIATRRIVASLNAEEESRLKPERQRNLFAEVPA